MGKTTPLPVFINNVRTVSIVVSLTVGLSPITWQRQPRCFHGNTSPLHAEEHSCFTVQTGW